MGKGKLLLSIFVIIVSIALTAITYSIAYGLGIQLFAEEIGHPLPNINAFVFIILAAIYQLLISGKATNKIDVDSEEFGRKFISIIITKIFWIIFCVTLYSIYIYAK